MPSSSPIEDKTGRCHLPVGGVSYTYVAHRDMNQLLVQRILNANNILTWEGVESTYLLIDRV